MEFTGFIRKMFRTHTSVRHCWLRPCYVLYQNTCPTYIKVIKLIYGIVRSRPHLPQGTRQSIQLLLSTQSDTKTLPRLSLRPYQRCTEWTPIDATSQLVCRCCHWDSVTHAANNLWARAPLPECCGPPPRSGGFRREGKGRKHSIGLWLALVLPFWWYFKQNRKFYCVSRLSWDLRKPI